MTAVSGREQARSTLLGCTRTWEDYRPLLDERFLRRGAYVIPAGSHDWSRSGTVYSPPVEPVPDDPDAWHPEDVLLVVLKASDGSLLGVMSVDEPASLRRPNDDDLDVLVTVAEHVALAIEDAQTNEVAARNRAGIEHLLKVSLRLAETQERRRDPPVGRRRDPPRAWLRACLDRAHPSERGGLPPALVRRLGVGGTACRADSRLSRSRSCSTRNTRSRAATSFPTRSRPHACPRPATRRR